MSGGRRGSCLPQVDKESDLALIRDFAMALSLMEHTLHIPIDGVDDLAQALTRIKTHFGWTADPACSQQERQLKEAVVTDRENRQEMLQLVLRAQSYLLSLPEHFLQDLRLMFPALQDTMQSTLQQLSSHERLIVIAGEQGAGKSSLVNLLAGCKILPTDLLMGTKTICELRHSESRKFVLHHWADRQAPTVRECFHDKETAPFLEELKRMITCVDQETEESPFLKIEVFWPLPVLGDGVVMVDSPGVGESRKVSHQLEQYMARAFGFIYVLNIGNAGGLHKYRLGQLLRQAVERSDQTFDPSTALFVCNRWDQVALQQEDQVLQEMLIRLARVWPGIRLQQIFPLSSSQALEALKRGQVDDRYRKLVEGIRYVLPVTFNVKLTQHYRWLSSVLKRSLYSLKISYTMGHKQIVEKETTFHSIRSQIDRLEKESDDDIDIMRDNFRREVASVSRKLIAFLRSECLQELSRWTPDECPPHEKDTKKVLKEAASIFAGRLASLVDLWEKQNSVVDKVRTNVLKAFQRNLELFEDQVKRVEGVLFQGMDKSIVRDLHNSMKRQMPVKNVWKKARKEKKGYSGSADVDGCFSLGSAISSCRSLDLRADPVRHVFRNGIGPQAMGDACKLFLAQFRDEDVASATNKFFDRICKRFDATSELLAEFLKADRNLLRILQKEVAGEQERLSRQYPDLLRSVTGLQGSLDHFYVQRLMRFEFIMDDLPYQPTSIGSGNFADVYSCTPTGGEQVALKIQKDELTPKNVTDVLLEDRTLRDMEHDNIIRYYGAALQRDQAGALKWVMVLEFCPITLKKYIHDSDTKAPGKPEVAQIASLRLDAMREVALLASQISSALSYLHNKGIVHRDLKPENIMLTEDKMVKLTDVGLAKPVRDISGTFVGTPAYMAPEILLEAGQYDVKADVYSLSMIVWELWYGQEVAEELQHKLIGSLEEYVKKGRRPELNDVHRPPQDWVQLIQAGWDAQADNRPHSLQFKEFFDSFLTHNLP